MELWPTELSVIPHNIRIAILTIPLPPVTDEPADPNTATSAAVLAQTFGTFGLSRPEHLAVLLKKHSLTNGGTSPLSTAPTAAGTPDPSITIGQPYVTEPNECSVQSCLNAFVAAELLSGNNKVTCEACTKRAHSLLPPPPPSAPAAAADGKPAAKAKGPPSVLTNATKQFLVSSLPAVLILHLKRFQLGMRHRVQKIHTDVTFPLLLDMGPFCAASPQLGQRYRSVHPAQRRILYALYGVVVHQGQMGSGHYVAYVKVRPKLSGSAADDRRWRFVSTHHYAEQQQAEATATTAEQQQQPAGHADTNGWHADSAAAGCDSDDDDDAPNGEQLERRARAERERAATAEALAAEAALVRPPDGKWYHVSDSRVSEVPVETVLKAQAYLLFYERIF